MEIYTNNFRCLLVLLEELNTNLSVITKLNIFSIFGLSLEYTRSQAFAAVRGFRLNFLNKLFIYDFLLELNLYCIIGIKGMSAIRGLNFIRWVSYHPYTSDLLERERERENLNNKYKIS
jgi:hypothetical protein